MTAPYQPPPPESGMTAAQLAVILAMVQAQAKVRQRLTDTAVAAALAAFRGFTGWWDPGEVSKVIAKALKIVQPTQKQAARVTDAYLTSVARKMTGKPQKPAGVVDVTKLRREIPRPVAEELVKGIRRPAYVIIGDTVSGPGEDINSPVKLAVRDAKQVAYAKPADPYGRIADQYRFSVITQGRTEEEATDAAMERVAVAVENDVTAAVREQYHKTMGQQKADGYRRILHPELTKSGPCGLCQVAADRVYSVSDLLPLHGRCVCEVLPIYGKQDPGIDLNFSDLDRLYRLAAGNAEDEDDGRRDTSTKALARLRVAIAENGEMGPVLVNADHNHRDPVDVAKRMVASSEERDRMQLDQWERSYETLSLRSMHGENVNKSLKWQRDRILELRKRLGITGPQPLPSERRRAAVNA